jgi:ribosome-binding factor A
MASIHNPAGEEDPSLYFGGSSGRKNDWKDRRLCRQVLEAVQTGLSGQCGDDVLQSLWVSSVVPAPDASRLAVTVVPPEGGNPAEALARLEGARGLLRAIVASAIHRKRVPELLFRVSGPEEVAP